MTQPIDRYDAGDCSEWEDPNGLVLTVRAMRLAVPIKVLFSDEDTSQSYMVIVTEKDGLVRTRVERVSDGNAMTCHSIERVPGSRAKHVTEDDGAFEGQELRVRNLLIKPRKVPKSQPRQYSVEHCGNEIANIVQDAADGKTCWDIQDLAFEISQEDEDALATKAPESVVEAGRIISDLLEKEADRADEAAKRSSEDVQW